MAAAAILKNHKNRDISVTVRPIFMKFGRYADAKYVPKPLRAFKNSNFTNPRWPTAAILKTVKSPYLCSRLTDFDEILNF